MMRLIPQKPQVRVVHSLVDAMAEKDWRDGSCQNRYVPEGLPFTSSFRYIPHGLWFRRVWRVCKDCETV